MFTPTSNYDGIMHPHVGGGTGLEQPMTLGSPTPMSPVQSPFLPGFLLGDKAQRVTPTSPTQKLWGGVSPPRSHMRSTGPITPASQFTHQSPFNLRSDTVTPSLLKEKVGAPPIRSLTGEMTASPGPLAPFSHVHTPSKHVSFSNPPVTPRTAPTTPAPPTSGLNATTLAPDVSYLSPPSPTQVDPFYTQGEQLSSADSLDESCVTVFGFPPAATSYILQQFSQYGAIMKYSIATDGNWMHLRFQSRLQAKKALSKNGKIFGNGIMIGVTNCIDRSIMATALDDTNQSVQEPQSLETSARIDSIGARGTPTMIRPLTAAYQAAKSENEVLVTGSIPHKNNNLVSKAMEYMFGW